MSHLIGARWSCLVLIGCVVGGGVGSVEAGDWPQFLGPDRNGISGETGLLDDWPVGGPPVVWRQPGGVGMSGLAVRGKQLVTLVQNEGKQWLICLDAVSGKPQWRTPVAPAYENGMGDGPRATPCFEGENILGFTGEGVLFCAGAADGKIRWSHDTVKELKAKVADYGMACSPLVVGKNVVVTVGAPGACVAAYDIKSGKLAWTAGNDKCGYSSPALLDVGGRKQLVVYTGSSVLGLDPKAGDQLWRFPYVTNFDCNIVTPLEFEGRVFISSGENHGSALLKLTPAGGKFDVKEEWGSHGPQSVLRNEWQTSMLVDGRLYGFDNVGGAGPVSHLTCVDAATGKRLWQQARFGKGDLIAADGKLWMSTMRGELVVARISPDAYKELGRTTVLGQTRQMPTLANGRLYLRDDKEIVCVDVRGKK